MFQHLCATPYWVFKHFNTFLSLKVFVFNHIVPKKASLQSDYSRLKTVHHNYNSKKTIHASRYFFILKHFEAIKTLKLLNKHLNMFMGNTYFFRVWTPGTWVLSRHIENSWDFKMSFRSMELPQKVLKTQEKEIHHVKKG